MSQGPDYIKKDVWLNSQYSVARHYGGCSINGVRYEINYLTGDLVKMSYWNKYLKEHGETEKSYWKKVKEMKEDETKE